MRQPIDEHVDIHLCRWESQEEPVSQHEHNCDDVRSLVLRIQFRGNTSAKSSSFNWYFPIRYKDRRNTSQDLWWLDVRTSRRSFGLNLNGKIFENFKAPQWRGHNISPSYSNNVFFANGIGSSVLSCSWFFPEFRLYDCMGMNGM